MNIQDFQGWLLQRAAATGMPEEHLLQVAAIGVNRHIEAAERWAQLEIHQGRSAPLWLREKEADKLLAAIRGQKSSEIRLLRQSLVRLFRD